MSKYLDLIKADTNYAKHMRRLSKRIFGEVTRETHRRSMKVVQIFSEKPINKRQEIVNYYPRHYETLTIMSHLRNYGLYRDEHQDFREEYDRLRELRGKVKWVPPLFRK